MWMLKIFLLVTLFLGFSTAVDLQVWRDTVVRSEKVDDDIVLYSARATFKRQLKDTQLVQLAKDAYDAMQGEAEKDNIEPKLRPKVMVALAVHQEVFLTSSAMGPPLLYDRTTKSGDKGQTPQGAPPELMRMFNLCSQNFLGGAKHQYEASCGDINAFLAYSERTGKDVRNLAQDGRLVVWGVGADEVGEKEAHIMESCYDQNDWKFGCDKAVKEFYEKINVVKDVDPEPYDKGDLQVITAQHLWLAEHTCPLPKEKALTVQQVTIPNPNKKGAIFLVYGTRVTFTDPQEEITDAHIVALAQAAFKSMAGMKPPKKIRQQPTVMSALKVDNEVFLASSMKGGLGAYIYTAFEGERPVPPTGQNTGAEAYGEFTNVLIENAPDVRDALQDCSIKAVDQYGKRDWEFTNTTAASITGQGLMNTKQSGESLLPRGPDENIIQHRFNANCGEIMVSLAYRMAHKKETDKLRHLKPKPKIVAWEKGEAEGNIKPACEHSQGNNEEEKCGEGWGCAAFTGETGMGFDVIREVKKEDMISLSDPTFPKFKQHPVEFPRLKVKKETSGPSDGKKH
ncbi:hypothetical protein BDV38DRAFT_284443 [Aspergillus pseudotamarii]|uniref:Uncharacterized protein n=1 Tax=Aspergillus pseudotamarii TaxID=132259 RepID=A0A5N6SMP7_ASPPS|nr:uncharacterized protein BDV38DRAFT_284443 [Aspergillus pseudotamarii]KAE8135968.1 hypothetical protein BDV38DRAFT_284443 [Aspergillus pseudotamarii]